MKIAVLGMGYWGTKISEVLKKTLIGKEVFLYEKDEKKIGGNIQPYENFLSGADFTHAFIVTPEHTHTNIALECLRKNCHVFIEKPLALQAADAKTLLLLSKTKKRCIFLDETFLYDDAVHEIRHLILKGLIGELKTIYSLRHSTEIKKEKICVSDDLAPHDIYLARSITGNQIKDLEVINKFGEANHCSSLFIKYKLENKVEWIGDYSWILPKKERIMRLFGTGGYIQWEVENGKSKICVYIRKYQDIKLVKEVNIQQQISPLEKSIVEFLKVSLREEKKEREFRLSRYLEDVKTLDSIRRSISLDIGSRTH